MRVGWVTRSRRRLSAVGAAGLLLGGGLVLVVTAPATADTGVSVTSVNPGAALDTGGTVVAISGTGFTGATAVDFGTVAGTDVFVQSATSLLVTTPAESDGVVDVTVVTPTGTSAVSPADQFTFVPVGSPPTLTSVTPNAGTTAGGIPFTITGTGFTGTTDLLFGATTIPFVVSSDTSISATSPVSQPGVYDIEVQTPNGGTAVAANDRFTVTAPQPIVSAVTPNAGTVDGGESVMIGGSGFTFTSSVDFGTTSVPFVVNSDRFDHGHRATLGAGPRRRHRDHARRGHELHGSGRSVHVHCAPARPHQSQSDIRVVNRWDGRHHYR